MTDERRGTGGWDTVLSDEAHAVAPGAEWRSELWRVATTQFDAAADLIALEDDVRARLREPRRALTVNFPVRRDTGEVEILTGYRVQHSLAMGPTKGGVRFAPGVSLGECAALAMWMTSSARCCGCRSGVRRGACAAIPTGFRTPKSSA
jgi:glutamate dehydrogenase (NAD(P)+)